MVNPLVNRIVDGVYRYTSNHECWTWMKWNRWCWCVASMQKNKITSLHSHLNASCISVFLWKVEEKRGIYDDALLDVWALCKSQIQPHCPRLRFQLFCVPAFRFGVFFFIPLSPVKQKWGERSDAKLEVSVTLLHHRRPANKTETFTRPACVEQEDR